MPRKCKECGAEIYYSSRNICERCYDEMSDTMTKAEVISRKTGQKPSNCNCSICQSQCRRSPCLGTPEDILKIIEAGYGDRLSVTGWAAGIIMGVTRHVLPMVQAEHIKGQGCTFFKNGLCELHNLNLKPTEGRLSHHSMVNNSLVASNSVTWHVAKEWGDAANGPTIDKIIELLFKEPDGQ